MDDAKILALVGSIEVKLKAIKDLAKGEEPVADENDDEDQK